MSEKVTDWTTENLKFFRLSKFDVDRWFDGTPHLLQRDVDFPGVMANSDISRKLRNAAYYRKMKVAVVPTSDGLIVQSSRDPRRYVDEEDSLPEQLFQALRRNDDLEEVLKVVSRTLETTVKGLEQKVSLLEEELSLLKRRRL